MATVTTKPKVWVIDFFRVIGIQNLSGVGNHVDYSSVTNAINIVMNARGHTFSSGEALAYKSLLAMGIIREIEEGTQLNEPIC
jgi:hypothetical protein